MMADSFTPLLTTEEVARYLNIEVITVRRLVQRGELAAYRIGGEYRFSEQDLQHFLDRQYVPAKNESLEHADQFFTKPIRDHWRTFTKRAKQALVFASEEARQLHHPVLEAEHLLVGLIREEEGVAGKVLREFSVPLERARQGAQSVTQASPRKESDYMLHVGASVTEALERAGREAQQIGHDYIGTEHLLLGLLDDSNIGVILSGLNVEIDAVRKAVMRYISGQE
jgi:excisionase family DNA binding protein